MFSGKNGKVKPSTELKEPQKERYLSQTSKYFIILQKSPIQPFLYVSLQKKWLVFLKQSR